MGDGTYDFGFDGRGIVAQENVHPVVERLVACTVVGKHQGEVDRFVRHVELEVPFTLWCVFDFVHASGRAI